MHWYNDKRLIFWWNSKVPFLLLFVYLTLTQLGMAAANKASFLIGALLFIITTEIQINTGLKTTALSTYLKNRFNFSPVIVQVLLTVLIIGGSLISHNYIAVFAAISIVLIIAFKLQNKLKFITAAAQTIAILSIGYYCQIGTSSFSFVFILGSLMLSMLAEIKIVSKPNLIPFLEITAAILITSFNTNLMLATCTLLALNWLDDCYSNKSKFQMVPIKTKFFLQKRFPLIIIGFLCYLNPYHLFFGIVHLTLFNIDYSRFYYLRSVVYKKLNLKVPS